jgi:ADP-ribosyl-[dinitrogen reductase] hydrolase
MEGSNAILSALEGKRSEPGAVLVLAEAFRFVQKAQTAEQAIVDAVTFGGDTDTRGAVAGALAGARWGAKTLPQRWIDQCLASTEANRLCNLLFN